MVKITLCFSLFIFHFSFCFAQQPASHAIDSLTARIATEHEDSNKVNTLLALYDKIYHNGDHDKAMQYAVDALDLSKSIYYRHGESIANRAMAQVYYTQLKYADALHSLNAGLKIATDLNDTSSMALFYTRIGLVYFRLANQPEALQADLTSLKLREEIKDSASMVSSLINIGNVYSEQGNFSEALKYEKKALRLSLKYDQKNNISACYNNLGGIEVKSRHYGEALENFNKSIEVEEKMGDNEGIAIAYGNVGEIYVDLGRYDTAVKYIMKSLVMKKKGGYRRVESSYEHLAELNNLLKHYAVAKLYADTVLKISLATGSKDCIQSGYESLSRADSGMGDFRSALANYMLAESWRDSLVNDENTKKTVQAEMNYAFDKKQDAEKAEQDKKDLLQHEQSRKQQITIYFISGILFLVILFAFVVVRSLRQNRRKTVIISKQKEEVEKQKEEVEKQKAVVEQQKAVVEEKNELIEQQKAVVEEKNKDITDSIRYASRIQRALLTTDEYITEHVKEHFILFKPRDIVSGDFYWAFNGYGVLYLACCDCTGHGVPGAFMSLLNISMLNESVIERKIIRPDRILNDVRDNIIKALNPDRVDTESQDGMDCSLCAFDFKNGVLQTACANNPVWIVRKDTGELEEIAPDKMPVGIQYGDQKSFTVRNLKLNQGDVVYMFTDGYADQFGGPKGKKFKYKALSEKIKMISDKPMQEQKNILEQTFEEWRGNLEQVDDVLIMGIRV